MTAGVADVLGEERFERRVKLVVPLKALGSPEQVAEAIVFLASDKSGFTTGSSLVVDGGWTAQRGCPDDRSVFLAYAELEQGCDLQLKRDSSAKRQLID
jgi:hypothetical protein